MLTKIYHRYIRPNKRLNFLLLPTLLFIKFMLDGFARLPRQVLQIDLVRMLICLPRYVVFYLVLRRRKFSEIISDANSQNTIEHNMRGVGELSAPRSHILIRPVCSVGWVARHSLDLKVLSIGPRVEGEIYNIIGHGFRKKNITAVDLFSYSPLIGVGDMHNMQFEDSSFDIVICGWVLGYSNDRTTAAREILRVAKPGGLISIGNAYTARDPQEQSKKVNMSYEIGSAEVLNSLSQIEAIFGIDAKDYIFRSEGAETGVDGDSMIAVFRKPGAPNTVDEIGPAA
jgi:hypothetical protein